MKFHESYGKIGAKESYSNLLVRRETRHKAIIIGRGQDGD
jgi:hypothetical protein